MENFVYYFIGNSIHFVSKTIYTVGNAKNRITNYSARLNSYPTRSMHFVLGRYHLACDSDIIFSTLKDQMKNS